MNSRWILKLPCKTTDIYFTNEELTDEQKSLIEWYRDVFRPEDLRLVESVQKGLKSRGYRGQGRIMADSSGSGISRHLVSPISIICWRRCLRTNDIGGGVFPPLG